MQASPYKNTNKTKKIYIYIYKYTMPIDKYLKIYIRSLLTRDPSCTIVICTYINVFNFNKWILSRATAWNKKNKNKGPIMSVM